MNFHKTVRIIRGFLPRYTVLVNSLAGYVDWASPDLVAHVAVGEVEAGQHHRLQLRLLRDAGVHAVSHLHTTISNLESLVAEDIL